MTEPSTPTIINVHGSAPQSGMVPVFSQPQRGELQVRQSLDVASTRKDVEDITVVRIQDMIRNKVGDLRKDLEAERANHTTLTRTHNTFLEGWTRDRFQADTRTVALEAALQPYTGKPLTVSYGVSSYNERTRNITGSVTLTSLDFSFDVTYSVSAPDTFITNLQAIRDSERRIKDLESQVLSTKNALNNSDFIRLQAGAAIATNHLSNTEGGKALLDAIEKASASSNVDDLIRKLQL